MRLTSEVAGPQFYHGLEPVFFRRSVGAAPGLPQFIGADRNILMPECEDAVSDRDPWCGSMAVLRLLLRLSRLFVPCRMILFPVLLGNSKSVRRVIFQFGGSLMVLVMRFVFIAG